MASETNDNELQLKEAVLETSSYESTKIDIGTCNADLGTSGNVPVSSGEEQGVREPSCSRSEHSTQSRASLNPYQITTSYSASKLVAYKPGALEAAVELCKKNVIQTADDGEVIGSWLLTDIDHWDLEREMLVLLTTNSLLLIKFDFITPTILNIRRIKLENVESVDLGDLVYPDFSVMSAREHGGVRVHWCREEPWFYQRWNPWCEDIGYITFTHHILVYNEKERETVTYNAGDFADSLVQAVNEARRQVARNDLLEVKEGQITIYSYANLASLVYNQSHIGFNMDRGGVSY